MLSDFVNLEEGDYVLQNGANSAVRPRQLDVINRYLS